MMNENRDVDDMAAFICVLLDENDPPPELAKVKQALEEKIREISRNEFAAAIETMTDPVGPEYHTFPVGITEEK